MYKELKSFHVNNRVGNQFGRLILKNGFCVDPQNNIEGNADIAILGDTILSVEDKICPEAGDGVIDCRDLLVVPGLIDMHLHMGDLFEQSTRSICCAVEDGITMGLSPGAGNTFMAPALLGAEIDRGLPINAGIFLGAPAVLATMMSVKELVDLFNGTLDMRIAQMRMTRNPITNATAQYIIGIKDHMGHFILSDEDIEKLFYITTEAGLVFSTHTQDPEHAERMVSLSKGRCLHLAHANAAGAGSHGDPTQSMRDVINLINGEMITGEFVTTMLRKGRGSREGLQMTESARKLALEALEAGIVKILVSDGQNQSTMKGFGDTRDNIPALLELVDDNILSLSDAIATMTCNPAQLIATRTGNSWWQQKVGNLSPASLANITVIDRNDKLATYTITNGQITAFENRLIRSGFSAGYWVSKFGYTRMGVGDITQKCFS
ncbi:MAG: amidohydrolase family protein [Lachnospiraceae bacterium]|nr:amidohydrolase family protein [Lachnospiraceae bacterium]